MFDSVVLCKGPPTAVCNTKKTNSRDICNFVSRIVRLIGKSLGYWIYAIKVLTSVTCICYGSNLSLVYILFPRVRRKSFLQLAIWVS